MTWIEVILWVGPAPSVPSLDAAVVTPLSSLILSECDLCCKSLSKGKFFDCWLSSGLSVNHGYSYICASKLEEGFQNVVMSLRQPSERLMADLQSCGWCIGPLSLKVKFQHSPVMTSLVPAAQILPIKRIHVFISRLTCPDVHQGKMLLKSAAAIVFAFHDDK